MRVVGWAEREKGLWVRKRREPLDQHHNLKDSWEQQSFMILHDTSRQLHCNSASETVVAREKCKQWNGEVSGYIQTGWYTGFNKLIDIGCKQKGS